MCPPSDDQSSAPIALELPQGTLAVFRYGTGPKVVFALPGFDYDAKVYASWEPLLGNQFTIYAIQLPFHGESNWKAKFFTPTDWIEIFTTLARKVQADRFTLLGHSLGGRIIVCTAAALEARIEQVWLLAPAGIGAFDRVPPTWMQRIAEWALKWPGWLRFLVNTGSRLGIVSNFHRRYAEVQLYPTAKRHRLFRIYNSITGFRTGAASIHRFWLSTQLPTLLLVARQDRFVPTAKIKAYFAPNDCIYIQEIDGNHHLVTANSAQLVRDNWQNLFSDSSSTRNAQHENYRRNRNS